MLFTSFINELNENFPHDIFSQEILYGNECHMNVNPEKIAQLCGFIVNDKTGALVLLFAADERNMSGGFAIYYVFSIYSEMGFAVFRTVIDSERQSFNSIAGTIYSAILYEKEIADMFGLMPEGHPDLRPLVHHGNWPEGCYPLRRDCGVTVKPPFVDRQTQFVKVEGTGVFEVPVGPVHAGIIEPGHFRFSVAGEPIINLEAQLYFVHRGIEKLCEGKTVENVLFFSERISGDETFANSLAYCLAIEKIAGVVLPERAEYSRVIFAEFERLLRHLSDLGGICVDVAYGFASSQFQLLLNWAYQIIEEVTGSRFLRSVNKPGGLRKDFTRDKESRILESIKKIEVELYDTNKIIKANSIFIDRVENTGVLSTKIAGDIHTVGPVARASGVCKDVRKDFPYSVYSKLDFKVPEHANGDVNCRMNVKLEECFASINLIRQALAAMPEGSVETYVGSLEPYKSAFGCVEAPRGENIHWVMTGENGTILRYKIRTPSFCNWPALCHAVKGNIIPDFPLINKSFNLSYAGNDL
jgi:Ni,Fe-hydrogenase III large subunit/Ni,Fe-hydrogenase III component G